MYIKRTNNIDLIANIIMYIKRTNQITKKKLLTFVLHSSRSNIAKLVM